LRQPLHDFFVDARLDIEITDRFGKKVRPREWFLFLVPALPCGNEEAAINDCTIACGMLSLQSIVYRSRWGAVMASLVVRNLDQRIVDALKQRAARHGRSAEAEHRALLETLLLQPKGKSFAEALTGMPNVGQDEDFQRLEDGAGNDHVFG
jgi:plasmid stability protein